MATRKKRSGSVGQSIGGIMAGIDGQIFRSTPPVHELIKSSERPAPVAASGGGSMTVGLPGDAPEPAPQPETGAGADPERTLRLAAPRVEATIDRLSGGRVASFMVDGRELLRTAGTGPMTWGSFPMAPYAGRVRAARFMFDGTARDLPITMPPHAIHGTVYLRPWTVVDDQTIATDLGPDWPFAGRAVQRFELTDERFTCRMELHADEPMPASIGWHPWFERRLPGVEGELELVVEPGAMYERDEAGIATTRLVTPTAGPWDDSFTDLREPPRLRWPGFLELTIESNCANWVIFTEPADTICVEPQTAPPDSLNTHPTIVVPGVPLVAEMTWHWRFLTT